MSLKSDCSRATGNRLVRNLSLLLMIAALSSSCTEMGNDERQELPFVTTQSPLRIVSANDGDALKFVGRPGSDLPDSVTVIDLSPDTPPVTRTVSGTVPNSYSGSPISALVAGGRYAFIPSHDFGYKDEEGGLPAR